MDQWEFDFKGAELVMEEGGAQAVAELKKDPTIKPAQMPFVKLVVLESASTTAGGGQVVLVLDADNRFFESRGVSVVFYGVDGPQVLKHLWRGTNGKPPELPTSKLK
jgi:hypothetical protein